MKIFLCDNCFPGGEELTLGRAGIWPCDNCGTSVDCDNGKYHTVSLRSLLREASFHAGMEKDYRLGANNKLGLEIHTFRGGEMKTSRRLRLWYWLIHWATIPEASILPRWLIVARFILLPLQSIFLWQEGKFYDRHSDIFTIHGLRISGELFRQWAKDGLPIGSEFRIIGRDDGVVSLQTIKFAPR